MKKIYSFIWLTYIISIYFSIFLSNTAYSQDNNEVFERITTKDGLSQSTVNYIIQDKKGFMWFATSGGINRYDGYTFKVYRNIPGDKNSLSHNGTMFLCEDRDGYIWIVNGFKAGLDRFDPVNESFTNYKNDPDDSTSISSNEVYDVIQDKSGNIWICTNNALNLVVNEIKGNKTFTIFRQFNYSKTNFVKKTYENRNGKLLLFADHLYYFDRKTNKIHKTVKLPVAYAYSKLSIGEDNSGNLWLGHLVNGVVKLVYNEKNQSYEPAKLNILNNVTTNNILIDYKDRIWIGTENKGLFRYDQKEDHLMRFLNDKTDVTSISDNDVVSLCVDRSGVLWIGTYTQGLCKFNLYKKEFYHFKSIPGNENSLSGDAVSCIHSSVHGELWVGIDLGGGINRLIFDHDELQQVIYYKHNPDNINTIADDRVLSLVQRKNGEVWAGSPGYMMKIIPEKPVNNNSAVIKNYRILTWTFCIYEDRQGTLWGGTWGGGLWRYDDSTDEFIFYSNDPGNPSSICDNIIWAISEDNTGNIWIGGIDKGISILPLKEKNKISPQFINFKYDEKNPSSLSNNSINVIFQDHTGTMWIGTNFGLNKVIIKDNNFRDINPGTKIEFLAYSMKDGLPSEIITGILEDKHNNLWLSTTNGLSKFNVKNNLFTNYNETDGLQSNEFTHNAYFKDRNGRMYFGGFNGFNAFYPDSIKLNPFLPEIVFTDLKIFNSSVKIGEKINGDVIISKSVNDLSEIILSHKNKVFTLAFAALHYAQTEKNQYAYKLEGFDKDWNYVGNKREATYTNLNQGKYIFKVKASNSDGIWNNKYTSLAINILPPWWRTWWAKSIYFLLIVLALYFFRKYILIYESVKHQLWLEHIEKQKSEELNKMKIQFFTNISHELRTPLSLILSPLESLINSIAEKIDAKNQLMLIYRNAERLYRLVNDLMDFSKIEDNKLEVKVQHGDIVKFTGEVFGYFCEMALKQSIDYKFDTKVSEMYAWFDRDKFEKIILNLLTNAFKFTSSKGKIFISVDKIAHGQLHEHSSKFIKGTDYASISVIDNGAGIAPEYLDKIFDRFYQAPVNESGNLAGTGIGLSLTKSLVELHHGFITVKSDPDKETVFTVFLPLGNSHFNSSEIIEKSVDVDINDVKNLTNDDNYKEENLMVIKKRKPKIIVVEDNLELREYLVSRLEENYRVIAADNGRSGYDKIVDEKPDLILSDILMPEVSGIELCRKIKEDITYSHIPVILLTAKASIDDKIEGIETGADAYVTKPFNLQYLEVIIRNLIESRRKLCLRFSKDVYIRPKEMSENPLDQDFLEKAINYVHDNITNSDLSLKDLARYLSMSKRNVYRKIKALTDQSTNDFIKIIRLKMAIKLMDERRLNISEIAFRVGFTSPAYFTKRFREQFGKPPSAYLSLNDTETEDINNE